MQTEQRHASLCARLLLRYSRWELAVLVFVSMGIGAAMQRLYLHSTHPHYSTVGPHAAGLPAQHHQPLEAPSAVGDAAASPTGTDVGERGTGAGIISPAQP